MIKADLFALFAVGAYTLSGWLALAFFCQDEWLMS
jgi:hypothetical protein